MSELGLGFDCASKNEIETVLKLGVDPSRIIYAQPCKTKSYVRYAANAGVKQMTFDNADELYKTKQLFPNAELFLRIITDDTASLCRLSQKFGAAMDQTGELLELAKKLELNVVGVAFHVGSGASDPKAFIKAVQDARFVFDQAAALGFNMHTLDVGGGFTGDATFEPMAAVLSASLDEYFPPHIRVIGEPGRYYVSTAFTIACHVIARRTVTDATLGTTNYMLYLNDGVYGNFSSIIFDHQHPVAKVLKAGNDVLYNVRRSGYETPTSQIEYSIWGPTCDGIDIVSSSSSFPELLRLVKILRDYPTVEILIGGHTDNQGDPALNVKLSEDRVEAVKKYLVSKGVDPKRLSTQGFGGTQPSANNDQEETRRFNRRVEFTITKK